MSLDLPKNRARNTQFFLNQNFYEQLIKLSFSRINSFFYKYILNIYQSAPFSFYNLPFLLTIDGWMPKKMGRKTNFNQLFGSKANNVY